MLPARNGNVEGVSANLIEGNSIDLMKEPRNPVRYVGCQKHG